MTRIKLKSGETLELLPCPWCGCCDTDIDDAADGGVFFRCESCEASGPPTHAESDDADADVDEAARRWNDRVRKRVPMSQAETMVDYLAAVQENFRLVRDMVLHRENPKAVEQLVEQQVQQLTIIRFAAAELGKGE